jgi:hypothetical protein
MCRILMMGGTSALPSAGGGNGSNSRRYRVRICFGMDALPCFPTPELRA